MRIAPSMFAAGLLLAAAANAGAAYPEPSRPLSRVWDRHVGYHARVYYGAYYQWPYDYRFRFDNPWYAGPSREHWPIPAPPPTFCDPAPAIIPTPYQ